MQTICGTSADLARLHIIVFELHQSPCVRPRYWHYTSEDLLAWASNLVRIMSSPAALERVIGHV
jgi:hypothetical protein